jgi:AraC-like DNA-binding protein
MRRLYAPPVASVSARSANDRSLAANPRPVPLRGDDRVWAGTYRFDGDDMVTGWHHHDLHQVEYAVAGIAEVETTTTRHLLPPQRAMWIPAGCVHNTHIHRVRSLSVFFDPTRFGPVDGRARVLVVAPVLREMILHAGRWPIDRAVSDPTADAFFGVVADLVAGRLDDGEPLSLPTTTDPLLAAAMDHAQAHLATVTLASAGRAVGLSERSLRRRFPAVTGITWRDYLLHARLLRAMARLAEPAPSVIDVATSVGFDSASAFTRAFRHYTGETPGAYRRRVRAGSRPGEGDG